MLMQVHAARKLKADLRQRLATTLQENLTGGWVPTFDAGEMLLCVSLKVEQ